MKSEPLPGTTYTDAERQWHELFFSGLAYVGQ